MRLPTATCPERKKFIQIRLPTGQVHGDLARNCSKWTRPKYPTGAAIAGGLLVDKAIDQLRGKGNQTPPPPQPQPSQQKEQEKPQAGNQKQSEKEPKPENRKEIPLNDTRKKNSVGKQEFFNDPDIKENYRSTKNGRVLKKDGTPLENADKLQWDRTHDDVEAYKKGKHIGSIDPQSKKLYKPPVPNRTSKN